MLQMEVVECGAVALGIVLAYHGRWVGLAELREACGVSRDGTQALNVVRAAARYGCSAKGLKKSLDAVQRVTPPFVAFWNFDHLLVVEGFDDRWAYLNDPADGRRRVTLEEFSDAYTGVVLTFVPTDGFERGGTRPSIARALGARLGRAVPALTYCVVAGLLLAVPGLFLAAITQAFIDNVIIRGYDDWRRPLLAAMGAVILVQAGLAALQARALRRMRFSLSVTMTGDFVWHLLRLPTGFYTQRFAGEIASRLPLNDRVAEVLSGRLALAILGATAMAAYASVMLHYDALLGTLAIAAAAIDLAVLQTVSRRRVDANRRLRRVGGMADGHAIAGLQSLETVKSAALEGDFFARWSGYKARVLNARQSLELSAQIVAVVPTVLAALAGAAVLVAGGFRVMDGRLSIGMLVAFQGLLAAFLAPVQTLVALGTDIQQVHADIERLDDVLGNRAALAAANSPDGAAPWHPGRGRLEFRHVTFGYNHLGPPLVDDFSLVVAPGDSVAIVGASGSGKSTLLRLVCGLYEPWSGEVLIDGTPVAAMPREALATTLAFVDQDATLFSGSVRDNLTLWDAGVPDAQLADAARDARVHDVVTRQPGGYDAPLREDGSNLSGGERQRLEIARALVHRPALLLLDEATSALDGETERAIVDGLRRRGCTVINVAHRLSTIRDAGQIIVMKGGRAVERGTHDELLAAGYEYARLIAVEGLAL
ncbi:MAG: NHLP family bacteriocin export ABC transporter peptidase/permease/ATPase subunit [Vicinamibacterales bacterium]